MRTYPRRMLTALTVLALVSGCSSHTEDSESRLMVFAAASLKQAFTEIGAQFESDHPGTTVEFSFAGSSDLVTQLVQGAEADVYASADPTNMTKATQAELVAGDPVNFATNTLTIAVAPGNPAGIASLRDLTRPGLQVVLCAPQVPCGAATEKAEAAAGVRVDPVSEESSVTDVLNKVTTGQADAGLVYVTDAAGAGDKVTAVGFPESAEAVNTYPIAELRDARDGGLARAFIDLVTGAAGQRVLQGAGFKAAGF